MSSDHTGNRIERRTMLSKAVVSGVALVSGVSSAGCLGSLGSDDGNPDPPVEAAEIQIIDVRGLNVGLTSATIPLVLEIRNSHQDLEIPSPTIDYNAYIEDEQVASAREDVASLGPGDSTREQFELIAEYQNIGTAVVDSIQSEGFVIRLSGTIESEGISTSFDDTFRF